LIFLDVVTVEFHALGDDNRVTVETITGTLEHPFMTSKGWVGMGSLGIGTEILTRAGPRLVVKSVKQKYYTDGIKVYNFTVDDKHTYFVGDSLGGAWVHNAPCPVVTNATKAHIFHGETKVGNNGNIRAVGFHHEGFDALGKARVAEYELNALGERLVDLNGVYRGKVEVFDSATNQWIAKTANGGYSTFFPRHWSQKRVLSEVIAVFNDPVNRSGNMFQGKSPSGIWIQGYINPFGEIATAFPIMESL
jgi:Bacterial EndoU nuclease/Pretoxin HINT domain